MQTIKLSEANARKMHATAPQEIKQMLEDSFGSDFFKTKITDRVKNFEDILSIAGKTMADLSRPGDTIDEIAYKQAKLISEVYNEGVILDPMDTDQDKYYPWHFIDKSSGFGLSFFGYGHWHTDTNVGSRLCIYFLAAYTLPLGKKQTINRAPW